ncbi:MAG: polysaccharide pyruvyl transferase family protein [Methanomicrobiales archaeon]
MNKKNHAENLNSSVKNVLLVGYNGANNTGSEARLLSIIDDVKELLGPQVLITIPTLNEKNLRRYISEGPNIRIQPIPSIFYLSLIRLVRKNDLIVLVEGSCYMDTWSSALLSAFLWATKYANKFNKPCIAYAVDAGHLSPSNQKKVKKEASKTDLIITRTRAAAEILKSIGVTAPIEVTADCAFTFKVDEKDYDLLDRIWPSNRGYVGLSVVDFHLWPVVMRIWGKKEYCYQWPYYFSRAPEDIKASDQLAEEWAQIADNIIEKYHRNIALICMENVDNPLAIKILEKMDNKKYARIFSSSEYNASQMTSILQKLDLLVTSRYHAGVLSLEKAVPQLAVGHDTRLKTFYQELGIYDYYFIDYKEPDAWERINKISEELINNPENLKKILQKGFNQHLKRAQKNPVLLTEFLKKIKETK